MKKRFLSLCFGLSVLFALCCSFFTQNVKLNNYSYAASSESIVRRYQLNTLSYNAAVYIKSTHYTYDSDLDDIIADDYYFDTFAYVNEHYANSMLTDGDVTLPYTYITADFSVETISDGTYALSSYLYLDNLSFASGYSVSTDMYGEYYNLYSSSLMYGYTSYDFYLYDLSQYVVNGQNVGTTFLGTPDNPRPPIITFSKRRTGTSGNYIYKYYQNNVEVDKFYIDLDLIKNQSRNYALLFKVNTESYYWWDDDEPYADYYCDGYIPLIIKSPYDDSNNHFYPVLTSYQNEMVVRDTNATDGIGKGARTTNLFVDSDVYSFIPSVESSSSVANLRFSYQLYDNLPFDSVRLYYADQSGQDSYLYQEGYYYGDKDGYERGLIDGDYAGYQNGLREGKSLGYNQGVLEANNYSFIGMLGAAVDVPVKAITGLLNFDFLGVNMLAFMLGILSIGLILFLIRKLKGSSQ